MLNSMRGNLSGKVISVLVLGLVMSTIHFGRKQQKCLCAEKDRKFRVPDNWRDAILVIPKKGDLSSCDNWCGISLLDVVGKVVARVLQVRGYKNWQKRNC